MINLIPFAFLKEECFLSDKIDERKYQPNLEEAQEDLKDTIGGEFYDEIETQYNASTLTTDNNTLYQDYIKKYLAWQTYYYYLGFANSDSTPTGEREFSEENSTVLTDVKMFSKERNVKNKANRWKGRLLNFLKLEQSKDATKYPLYEQTCVVEMSFGISAIDKDSDALFKVNKSIITNE